MYWGTTTPMPLVLDQWRARTGGKQHFFCLAQQRDRLSFAAPSSRLERSSCALWMQPTAHGEHPYLNAPPRSRPISPLSIQSTCFGKTSTETHKFVPDNSDASQSPFGTARGSGSIWTNLDSELCIDCPRSTLLPLAWISWRPCVLCHSANFTVRL